MIQNRNENRRKHADDCVTLLLQYMGVTLPRNSFQDNVTAVTVLLNPWQSLKNALCMLTIKLAMQVPLISHPDWSPTWLWTRVLIRSCVNTRENPTAMQRDPWGLLMGICITEHRRRFQDKTQPHTLKMSTLTQKGEEDNILAFQSSRKSLRSPVDTPYSKILGKLQRVNRRFKHCTTSKYCWRLH